MFLRQLIDWSQFVSRKENVGHIALADFLGAKIVDLVVTTNVDTLIEQAAKVLGERDFCPMISEEDINFVNNSHAPLLKLHGCGCSTRRRETLWCKSQLEHEPLKTRLRQLATWLRGHVTNRDLLIVGFWTDWAYLNTLLEETVVSTEPRTVLLIDLDTSQRLEAKSPVLWQWASQKAHFRHIQASGADFLNELRTLLSTRFVEGVWKKGLENFATTFGIPHASEPPAVLDKLSTEALYALRRHLTGVPANDIVRTCQVDDAHSLIGLLHLGLLLCGASLSDDGFTWNGPTYRLLHTPSRSLGSVRQHFSSEPPNPPPADRTICVGAFGDGGAPANIIERGVEQGVIRNSATASWETHHALLHTLSQALSE